MSKELILRFTAWAIALCFILQLAWMAFVPWAQDNLPNLIEPRAELYPHEQWMVFEAVGHYRLGYAANALIAALLAVFALRTEGPRIWFWLGAAASIAVPALIYFARIDPWAISDGRLVQGDISDFNLFVLRQLALGLCGVLVSFVLVALALREKSRLLIGLSSALLLLTIEDAFFVYGRSLHSAWGVWSGEPLPPLQRVPIASALFVLKPVVAASFFALLGVRSRMLTATNSAAANAV